MLRPMTRHHRRIIADVVSAYTVFRELDMRLKGALQLFLMLRLLADSHLFGLRACVARFTV
jgi:hypothetical protein